MKMRAKNNIISFFYLTIYLYLIQIINSVNPDPDNLQLIFVYQHIRHGARGPSASYNSLSSTESMNSVFHGKERETVSSLS